jgi:hypothetical protein
MVKEKWNLHSIPAPKYKHMKATFSWRVPYVVIVHEGATLKTGTVIHPRPWTQVAISEYDFLKQYAFNFGKNYDFRQAFINVSEEFGGVCQDAIASPIWEWDRTTFRRSGEVATSPRNIVDLGNLRDSYRLEFNF